MYELNSQRYCIVVKDSAESANRARIALLKSGVPFAWSDDTRNELANGYGVWVQECDARGAYARLQTIEVDLNNHLTSR